MNHQRSSRKPHGPSIAVLSVALVLTAAAESALAEDPPPRETPIPAPGRSVAANDQSSAISTNPANLGFLTSSEARWTWVRTSEESKVPARGHAFDFALALPWHVGTGLRIDFARPGGSLARLHLAHLGARHRPHRGLVDGSLDSARLFRRLQARRPHVA